MDKIYCTPSDINAMIIDLIRQIQTGMRFSRDTVKFTKVVGIRNGGIHISQPIARALVLPHEEVHISYRDGQDRREKPIIKNINFTNVGRVLLVDDLIDSSVTRETFKTHFGPFEGMAVLFWNEKTQPPPDYYARTKPDAWIVFPWEV